ncbi:MAG: hypothetical protein J5636_11635 [Clostridiales bacterium]|nr:hypothetical protein [Clostridiales bacterium]
MFSIFKKNKPDDELTRIFKEKGFYCDEYVQAFIHSRKHLSSDDHFTLCELYIEMERYNDAQKELLSVKPGSLLDIITTGQLAFCQIALYMGTGEYDDAKAVYEDKVKFLDTFMKNPVRCRIAGDYYSYAATICAMIGDEKKKETYFARMREWCDIYPKHRILLDITEVATLYAKAAALAGVTPDEAKSAKETCRDTILNFQDFNYEWERAYYLRKLERTQRLYLV